MGKRGHQFTQKRSPLHVHPGCFFIPSSSPALLTLTPLALIPTHAPMQVQSACVGALLEVLLRFGEDSKLVEQVGNRIKPPWPLMTKERTLLQRA